MTRVVITVTSEDPKLAMLTYERAIREVRGSGYEELTRRDNDNRVVGEWEYPETPVEKYRREENDDNNRS